MINEFIIKDDIIQMDQLLAYITFGSRFWGFHNDQSDHDILLFTLPNKYELYGLTTMSGKVTNHGEYSIQYLPLPIYFPKKLITCNIELVMILQSINQNYDINGFKKFHDFAVDHSKSFLYYGKASIASAARSYKRSILNDGNDTNKNLVDYMLRVLLLNELETLRSVEKIEHNGMVLAKQYLPNVMAEVKELVKNKADNKVDFYDDLMVRLSAIDKSNEYERISGSKTHRMNEQSIERANDIYVEMVEQLI